MASINQCKPLYYKCLGKGGCGQIFLCSAIKKSKFDIKKAFACVPRKQETKLYACKMPTQDSNHKEYGMNEKLLYREYEIMKHLKTSKHKHANLVKLKGFDKKQTLLIMEYCGGGSLSDFIKFQGQLSEFTACSVMQSLMNGISECHSMNVIHGDVKPDNILLTSKPPIQLKLCDFGMSRHFKNGETRGRGRNPGTKLFMAPEGFLGKQGMEADIWAAGVTLYYMLSGTYPFPFNTFRKIKASIEEGDSFDMFPCDRWHSISSEAKDVISQLLAFDPEKRMSVQEFYNHPWFQSHKNSKEACDEVTTFAIQKNKSREETFKRIQMMTDLIKN